MGCFRFGGALLEAWGAWGVSVLGEHCLKREVLAVLPCLRVQTKFMEDVRILRDYDNVFYAAIWGVVMQGGGRIYYQGDCLWAIIAKISFKLSGFL